MSGIITCIYLFIISARERLYYVTKDTYWDNGEKTKKTVP